MIRLSPQHFQRLEQATVFDIQAGGGELNVAVGCARLGLKTAWVSRLPKNPLGRMVCNKTREQGVDTSHIVWSDGDRIGLYFLEFGAAPRASNVLYDRANSAISKIKTGEVDWQNIFKNGADSAIGSKKVFHVSGITPALSKTAATATAEALAKAKENGCTVSYDLNYRAKLWSQEEAKACQEPMMKNVDILITTEEDTFRVFGIKEDSYEKVAQKLSERFGFEIVAITLREDISVWKNGWTAIAYKDGTIYSDRKYEVEIVDRVGAGDSFSAGFIYGYLKKDVQEGVRYGVAFSALKHSIPGDLNWATLEEVERLIKSPGLRIAR